MGASRRHCQKELKDLPPNLPLVLQLLNCQDPRPWRHGCRYHQGLQAHSQTNIASRKSFASTAGNLDISVLPARPSPRKATQKYKWLAAKNCWSWKKSMMMKKRRWCDRFLSNPWIFRLEEFPNTNPSFRVVCKCICKVVTYYANSCSTHHSLTHNESRWHPSSHRQWGKYLLYRRGFVRKHKLPTQHLKTVIQARNVDNSINSKGVIWFSTTLFLDIGEIARRITFHVLSLENENVILGLPWLKEVNPTINWVERTLSIKESLDQSQELFCSFSVDTKRHESRFICPSVKPPHHVNVNAIVDQHLFAYNDWETENEYIGHAQQNRTIHQIIQCGSRFIPAGFPIIAKLTTATELTAAAKKSKSKPTLPSEYSSFTSVFSKEATDHVPPSRPYDHKINLDDAFAPKIGKVYPLSPDERKATEDFLDENLSSGKIRLSNSPQAFPFFFIKKKDGGLHPCQDYCYINEHTICDTYPLPLISDLVDKLRDAKVFTKFDVCWGYNNVRIKDGHQWKTAFVTHKGLFKPTIMFFGLTNSPATFQRFMNDSFHNMIAEGWLVIYMDDLLIYSPDATLHEERTKHVLQCMAELDLHLKLEKCKFATDEVEYLGMIVKPGQLAVDPIKLNGIASWPIPTKVRDVRSFLGFANFYCWFIPDYSNVAHPLIDLTKKNLTWNWSPSCQSAFEALKHPFLSKPVLHLPNLSAPFAIDTDASKYASGAILLQTDSNGGWHPCSYLSQSFSPAERNYDIYDHELLAVIHALKSWQHYLHGPPFPVQVFMDHKNLTYFRQPQVLNCRQAQWLCYTWLG